MTGKKFAFAGTLFVRRAAPPSRADDGARRAAAGSPAPAAVRRRPRSRALVGPRAAVHCAAVADPSSPPPTPSHHAAPRRAAPRRRQVVKEDAEHTAYLTHESLKEIIENSLDGTKSPAVNGKTDIVICGNLEREREFRRAPHTTRPVRSPLSGHLMRARARALSAPAADFIDR